MSSYEEYRKILGNFSTAEQHEVVDLLSHIDEHIDLEGINELYQNRPFSDDFNEDDYDALLFLNYLVFLKRIKEDPYRISKADWEWFYQTTAYLEVPLEQLFTAEQLRAHVDRH